MLRNGGAQQKYCTHRLLPSTMQDNLFPQHRSSHWPPYSSTWLHFSVSPQSSDSHLKVIVHMLTMMWFYAFKIFIFENSIHAYNKTQSYPSLFISSNSFISFLTWPPHNFMFFFLNKVQGVIGRSACVPDYALKQPPRSPITNSSSVLDGLWGSSSHLTFQFVWSCIGLVLVTTATVSSLRP